MVGKIIVGSAVVLLAIAAPGAVAAVAVGVAALLGFCWLMEKITGGG